MQATLQGGETAVIALYRYDKRLRDSTFHFNEHNKIPSKNPLEGRG